MKESILVKRVVFTLVLLAIVCSVASLSSAVALQPSLDPAVTSGVATLNGRQVAFQRQALSNPLANSGDYMWWYGCSATSAGMMMGYYDRNGYAGKQYPNLVPGGVAEALDGPLERATIASARHISDFYAGGYGASGDDVAVRADRSTELPGRFHGHKPGCLRQRATAARRSVTTPMAAGFM